MVEVWSDSTGEGGRDEWEECTDISELLPGTTAHPMELCGFLSNSRLLITLIILHMIFRDGRRSGVWIWLHLGHGERRGRAGEHGSQQENTARFRKSLCAGFILSLVPLTLLLCVGFYTQTVRCASRGSRFSVPCVWFCLCLWVRRSSNSPRILPSLTLEEGMCR